jgi:hypothetical protein
MEWQRYPTLTLETNFPFGKFKGRPLHEILVEDPGYLLWLREQRWGADKPTDAGFDPAVHELLDGFVEDLPAYKRAKWRLRYGPGERHVEIAETPVLAEPTVEQEEWGAWG